jgi:hypothetical protein
MNQHIDSQSVIKKIGDTHVTYLYSKCHLSILKMSPIYKFSIVPGMYFRKYNR